MIQHASIDDSTLFERITRHDAEAFGIVMRRYAGALYAFAFRIVGKKTETIPRPIPT